MWVEVQVYAGLDGGGERTVQMEAAPGAVVEDIARQVGIPLEKVGLITVDGRLRGPEDQMEAGQRVCFFPPIMGG